MKVSELVCASRTRKTRYRNYRCVTSEVQSAAYIWKVELSWIRVKICRGEGNSWSTEPKAWQGLIGKR